MLIALSNLHAKVFVADGAAAIITSGNLTRSGLDRNLEYGVLLKEPELVQTVRKDMLAFARLGSQVDAATIATLAPLEEELRRARADITQRAPRSAKRRFNEVLRQARPALASMQVGDRSAHAVFGEAIQFVLARGPQPTKAIEREVSRLLPALCDDSDYFFIKGVRYGRTWKRRLRHAQQHLSAGASSLTTPVSVPGRFEVGSAHRERQRSGGHARPLRHRRVVRAAVHRTLPRPALRVRRAGAGRYPLAAALPVSGWPSSLLQVRRGVLHPALRRRRRTSRRGR